MQITSKASTGDQPWVPLVKTLEGLSFDYWGRPVSYGGKVDVIPKPERVHPKLEAFGDLIYAGDPPFALDEHGFPKSNAGCLFLPGVIPEITYPIFIACKVNHGEGFNALGKLVDILRGGENTFTGEEQLRVLTRAYSPARIIGEGKPDFLVRQESGEKGEELSELGRLFARHYLGLPSERVRIDVRDKSTLQKFIRSGGRYMLEPKAMSLSEEMSFLSKNRGHSKFGVPFYYSQTGERFLTADDLKLVIDDYKSGSDRILLERRLEDIARMRETNNQYKELVLNQVVPELSFFEVDESRFGVQDVHDVVGVRSAMSKQDLCGVLDGLYEKYLSATPPEYHSCDVLENPFFRRNMIKTLQALPSESPYELTIRAINPESRLGRRLLPLFKKHFGDYPMNIGVSAHTASKRANVGPRNTGLVEWYEGREQRLMHWRESKFTISEAKQNFRRMPDGRISGRDTLSHAASLQAWEERGVPLSQREARRVSEEYSQYRRDRVSAHRIYFEHLGDEDIMVESQRLGQSSIWARPFLPELIAIDKRPTRDHGDLDDPEARRRNIENTLAIQRSFGRLLCVNITAAANPLTGTGDELYNPGNPEIVRQTDATGCYRLSRLARKVTDSPSQYMMAAIYEMEVELMSEIMGASPEELGEIRGALLDSVIESQQKIEKDLPKIIDEMEDKLYDSPRSEHVGQRFNLPKKMLVSLARFINPLRDDSGELFNRIVNMQYSDGSSVLDPDDKDDVKIIGLINSARKGAFYTSPQELAGLISSHTDALAETGRRLISSERSIEGKSEVVDSLTIALGVDCNKAQATKRILDGDLSMPDGGIGSVSMEEKLDRLRSIKLMRAINSSVMRDVNRVEEHARALVNASGGDINLAEEKFLETLPNQFPGLHLTEEDARFFFYTILNPERSSQYRRLGYL